MYIFEYFLDIFIIFYIQLDLARIRWMPDGRRLKRALPKLENNVLQPPLAWSSNRRMKIDDWIRPYYENLRSPFVSGGMRWKLQEGRIVRVSVNESVKFQ